MAAAASTSPHLTAATVKTRILVLSDTHHFNATYPDLHSPDVAFHLPLPPADILIHAGDLTSTGLRSQHQLAVDLIRTHSAELKLVIAGNHDVTLDKDYYLKVKPHMAGPEYPEDVDAIRALYTGADAVADGLRFLGGEGMHRFTLKSGASFTVYASPYTPEFCNWAFAYPHNEDRFNHDRDLPQIDNDVDDRINDNERRRGGSRIPDFPAVDVMVTHGPPEGVLDEVIQWIGGKPVSNHVGCGFLWEAVKRARPRLHVFGHIHEGWGAERWVWQDGRNGIQRLLGRKDRGKGKRVQSWGNNVSVAEKQTWVKESGRRLDVSRDNGKPQETIIHGENTLFVNAGIMDVRYKPVNAPWIIDIDLPVEPLDLSQMR